MINSEYIYNKANEIISKSESRNPDNIAKFLNIEIYWNGDFENLLGMYTYIKRKKAIVLNSQLDEFMTKMVIAHEIGHDTLHRKLAQNAVLQEYELFDMRNTTEYEANAFAAHLLIGTDEVIEMAHSGYDISYISCTLGVNINLTLIKIQELIRLGYDLRMPMETRANFMKDIKL